MPTSVGIIFDVSSNREGVISHLKLNGYSQYWNSNGKKYTLPHNMLWKQDYTMAESVKDVERAVLFLNNDISVEKVKLLSCIAVSVHTLWDGIPDAEKSKEEKISELEKQLEELKRN